MNHDPHFLSPKTLLVIYYIGIISSFSVIRVSWIHWVRIFQFSKEESKMRDRR